MTANVYAAHSTRCQAARCESNTPAIHHFNGKDLCSWHSPYDSDTLIFRQPLAARYIVIDHRTERHVPNTYRVFDTETVSFVTHPAGRVIEFENAGAYGRVDAEELAAALNAHALAEALNAYALAEALNA